jgi:hypothetical protein
MAGWVKLHRSLSTSAIASKPDFLSVWIHLLMDATHKPASVLVGRQVVDLEPGQMVFGRKAFSAKTGVSEAVIRSSLNALQTLQQITIKSTTKYSIISIVNWQKYQEEKPADDQQTTNKQPTSNHIQEVQELKDQDQKHCAQDKPERVKNITVKQLVGMGVDEQHAKDWMAVRKTKRAPLTPTALTGVQREADKAGITLAQAIERAANNNWAGFKASWQPEVIHGTNTERSRPLSAVERVAAKAAERECQRQRVVETEPGDGFIEGEYSRAN